MIRFASALVILLCLCIRPAYGQQIPANIDFSTVNVDNLTDQQLMALLQKAQQNGLSVDDIVQQAQAKGMPPDQVAKLKDRLQLLGNGNQNQTNLSNNSSGKGLDYTRKYQLFGTSPEDSLRALRERKDEAFRKRIFGADLFSNANLTFEPNLNIATPENYVIGPGDELVINVYGYSESNDRLKVGPDGYINITNLGPVLVSGLTIKDARDLITHKLSGIYEGIAKGNTHVQVVLGDIRSIRVFVIGEITKPGTYTLPSLATVANALYVSGGPNINGSFRSIQVVRNGKAVANFDLYDFLQNGSLSQNVLLQDQDIVKVNPYQVRVEMVGKVKHPAIFEAKAGEHLADVINFAGGFTSDAYRGFIRAERFTNREREILTVSEDSISTYAVKTGDTYLIDSVVDKYTNRVMIDGAVFHPGSYALDSAMTVGALISKADGVREDALMTRGLIRRLKPDLTPEMLNFNVQASLTGAEKIYLEKEDSVIIYSKLKIREPYYLIVSGEVNKPDTLPFAEGMHVMDAILMAGGLKDAASVTKVEVSRRIRRQGYDGDSTLALIADFTISGDMRSDSSDVFGLMPFDVISVRRAPAYHEQTKVTLDGEVLYPGDYVLDSRNDRLTDLITRAGGLKYGAFAEGALLLRGGSKDIWDQYLAQNKIQLYQQANTPKGDTTGTPIVKLNFDSTFQLVGINLDKAMAAPGSKYDLLLQNGDVIRVPKRLETVALYGEVFYPKQVRFDWHYTFKDFVSQAGGFTANALKRRSYVVYPNGEVASTRKVLFFNRYPKVKPGSEVFIPEKPERKGLSAQEIIGMTSGIVAIIGILIAVLK